jgi:hypothetical protein
MSYGCLSSAAQGCRRTLCADGPSESSSLQISIEAHGSDLERLQLGRVKYSLASACPSGDSRFAGTETPIGLRGAVESEGVDDRFADFGFAARQLTLAMSARVQSCPRALHKICADALPKISTEQLKIARRRMSAMPRHWRKSAASSKVQNLAALELAGSATSVNCVVQCNWSIPG